MANALKNKEQDVQLDCMAPHRMPWRQTCFGFLCHIATMVSSMKLAAWHEQKTKIGSQ